MTKKKTKVAILGGAFDPITNAHTKLVEFILKNSEFEEVWLMPSNIRSDKQMVESNHRVDMIMTAIEDSSPNIKILTYEIDHKLEEGIINVFNRLINDPNYSEYKFAMIIGIDQANNIEKWINYDELIKTIPFIVVSRKGYRKKPTVNWFTKKPHIYLSRPNYVPNISSTEVRFAARYLYNVLPNSETYLKILENINPNVLNYIKNHRLYE